MDHFYLKSIYDSLCSEPYRVSTEAGVEAPNCYFKGLKFLKSATELGYMARGCVADISWDIPIIPKYVRELLPQDVQETHFYIEIIIDGEKRILDPSIDSKTAQFIFRKVPFEGDDKTCFDVGLQYSHAEQVAIFEDMNNDENTKAYFIKMGPFLNALNEWLEAERAKL